MITKNQQRYNKLKASELKNLKSVGLNDGGFNHLHEACTKADTIFAC